MDYDIFIIGGGINGCGVARDAAGRGLRVGLAEMNDLGGATSSASTKLFHGGLRYLEYFEFGLVRHALQERDLLLNAMPHISWPMRFVLPYHKDMRFEGTTSASKLLSFVMPWMKGRRPAWMIRFGLFLYDTIGGRSILPKASSLDLTASKEGKGLEARFGKAFEYSDGWVDDARLVALNARDAATHGADILVRTKVVSATRHADHWDVVMEGTEGQKTVTAKTVVNAAGPWVSDVLGQALRVNSRESVRLVRGSHIVVPRIFEHDKCYFFQGNDGRIIFAIPYLTDFTLIGTTDQDHPSADEKPVASEKEQAYLIDLINGFLDHDLTTDDIKWTYSGVRPLYDDGASSAAAATRDYVLSLDSAQAPLLTVFGGKITTYRKLAEDVLDKLASYVAMPKGWTEKAKLPGGEFELAARDETQAKLGEDYPFMDAAWALRMFQAYGLDTRHIYGDATSPSDLGHHFGANLYQAEVDWLITHEFATNAHDILWRRSKLGLFTTDADADSLQTYVADKLGEN